MGPQAALGSPRARGRWSRAVQAHRGLGQPRPPRPRTRSEWVWADGVVRRLGPYLNGAGFVTAELVCVVQERCRWPLVAWAPGSPPGDGILFGAPAVVLTRAGRDDPAEWLALGAATVWVVAEGRVVAHTARGRRTAGLDGHLAVPRVAGLRVPVRAFGCTAR